VPPDWLLALLDVAAIAAIAWIGGTVMQRLRQPRIVGEAAAVFAAGLLLGGQIADVVPGQQAEGRIADMFPETALALVSVVGGLGLVLYMLLVGITINPASMRGRARAVALLAAATIGAMLALALVAGPLLADAHGWKPPGVSESAFVLALAAALAANGLPIVARILEDRATAHSAVGSIVIVAATFATALALIAAAVAIGGGDVPAGGRVALRVGAGLVVLAIVLAIVRARWFSLRPAVAPFAVVALTVLSALAGDELLCSLLIGPLIVGVAVNKDGVIARALERRLGIAVRRVGLPVYLGLAALHTDLRELTSDVLAPVLAILVTVIALKVAAAYLAARTVGFDPADARAIGALMQCGGVMTIAISLEILHAHLIATRMHATLTVIGLATTIAAGPLLPHTWRRRRRRPDRAGPDSSSSRRAGVSWPSLQRRAS
jgi:Kef-type K+ transport system membrane component KefB